MSAAYVATILLTTIVSAAAVVGPICKEWYAERTGLLRRTASRDLGWGAAATTVRASGPKRRAKGLPRPGALKTA